MQSRRLPFTFTNKMPRAPGFPASPTFSAVTRGERRDTTEEMRRAETMALTGSEVLAIH
jgi:hypothetical protein